MNILKVWDGEYPWDVRAEKVCSALTDAGHQVHMVARNRDGRVLCEELPECTVHRLRPFRAFGPAIDAASQFPAFLNPRWFSLMKKVGREVNADLVLVRDLPLGPTAILVARQLGVPVVLDMAENYPAMIRDLWTTGSTKPGDLIVRNPKAVEVIERWTLKRVDHTLVVVKESGERLIDVLGVDPESITVVGNTPSRERVAQYGGGEAAEPPREDDPLRLIYLGLLEHARGVGAIIEAVAAARSRGVPITFTVIGDGRASDDFKGLSERLQLSEDVVRFLGFVPYERALEYFREADVGVIPHLANESWNTTIPNKLFDYMAAGLAVLTSDAVPTRRVVESVGCGTSFTGGSTESATQAIERLRAMPGLPLMGERGRDAVRDHFNWERDGERLVQTVSRIGRPESGGGRTSRANG
jgi:glycosyltransferase involved in cell wall biosynthesis